MISKQAILDAVNVKLVALGKGWTVYRDALPEKFDRPSYHISFGERTSKAATHWSCEITQKLCIMCIGALDANGNADTDALALASDDVAGIFAFGFLTVDDRALHIDEDVTSRPVDDGMEVTITLRYLDERPGESDTEPLAAHAQVREWIKEE